MTSLPPLLERDVTRITCDFLRAHNWRLVRLNVTSMPLKGQWVSFGERGMPDWLAIYYLPDGLAVLLWLEFKSKKGKLSLDQELWHIREEKCGATVCTISDFESFHDWYLSKYDLDNSPVKGQRELLR